MKKYIYGAIFVLLSDLSSASWPEEAIIATHEAMTRAHTAPNRGSHFCVDRQSNFGPIPDLNQGTSWFSDFATAIANGLGATFGLVFSTDDEELSNLGPEPRPRASPETHQKPQFAAKEKPSKYADKSSPEILQSIKQVGDCQEAFDYLNTQSNLIGFNSKSIEPFVLAHFVDYLVSNPNSFPKLTTLMWPGHQLDGYQVHSLLSFFSGRKAFLDLCPGPDCDTPLLVALAHRYCLLNPQLNITITHQVDGENIHPIRLPAGLDLSNLPTSLTIGRITVYEDHDYLETMKAIMDPEKHVNVILSNGMVFKL